MPHLKTIYYDHIETPIGPLTLIFVNADLMRIDFGTYTENELKIKKYLNRANLSGPLTEKEISHPIKDELKAYFDKQLTTFTLPKKMYGTDFKKDVWQDLLEIPFGQ